MTPSQKGGGGDTYSVKILVPIWKGRRYTVEEQPDKNINRKALRKSPALSFQRRGTGEYCKDMFECGNLMGRRNLLLRRKR